MKMQGAKKTAVFRRTGFTLTEMLAVLAVLSVLLIVAIPGFQTLIRNNRMISEVYSLRATLNQARSEALSRRAPVVVCPTLDGDVCSADTVNWRQGYMTFIDTNNDNVPDPNDPDEEQIQVNSRTIAVDILFDNPNRRIRFDSQGQALGFEGTFAFCDPRGARDARGLILNPVGSVRAAIDTDDPLDDIVNAANYNDAGGSNVGC